MPSGGVKNAAAGPVELMKTSFEPPPGTDAEATMKVAQIAREGHFEDLAPERIFTKIQEVTGPAPDRGMVPFPDPRANAEAWRRYALARLGACSDPVSRTSPECS